MALVAFDFDGTLVDGDAGVRFARHLAGERYREALGQHPLSAARDLTRLNTRLAGVLARGAGLPLRYALGNLDRRGMVERAYRGFAGLPAEDTRDEMAAFAREELVDHLRGALVDQLDHHVGVDDQVAVVSTGPHAIIWPLVQAVGWTNVEVVACRLLEEDGDLTGEAEGPLNGAEKLTRVRALAKRRDHDLDEAWAYGDHEDDEPLLAAVGNPVAVHPSARLLSIARRNAWPILWDG